MGIHNLVIVRESRTIPKPHLEKGDFESGFAFPLDSAARSAEARGGARQHSPGKPDLCINSSPRIGRVCFSNVGEILHLLNLRSHTVNYCCRGKTSLSKPQEAQPAQAGFVLIAVASSRWEKINRRSCCTCVQYSQVISEQNCTATIFVDALGLPISNVRPAKNCPSFCNCCAALTCGDAPNSIPNIGRFLCKFSFVAWNLYPRKQLQLIA